MLYFLVVLQLFHQPREPRECIREHVGKVRLVLMQTIEVVREGQLLEVRAPVEHVSATNPNTIIVDLIRLLNNSIQLGRLILDVLAAFAPPNHLLIECLALILGLLDEKLLVRHIAVAYFHAGFVQGASLREVYNVELDRSKLPSRCYLKVKPLVVSSNVCVRPHVQVVFFR